MEKIKRNYIFLLAAALLVTVSCRKEIMPTYEQNAGVFFSQNSYSYSFMYDPSPESEVDLLVNITGFTADYDRTFTVAHPALDTVTTAEPGQYVIGQGIVPAGSTRGRATITVRNSSRIEHRIDTLLFEIVPSDDFPETRINRSYATVAFTRMVMKPANWDRSLSYYFGTYSTRWYLFILSVTGTELPYWIFQDTTIWWMTGAQFDAHVAQVRLALEKYNRENYPDVLTHDDGDTPGAQVTMP